jgi:competence protein ComEA
VIEPMLLRDRALVLLLAGSAVAATTGAWLVLAPPSGGRVGGGVALVASETPRAVGSAAPSGTLVVDVEGAVRRPGIVRLPAGARVADALRAAGGYAPTADVAAAGAQLNLAAPLVDGAQVVVPRLGAPTSGGSAPGGAGSAGGLVDLNHATPEQLDTLPGIGPVTVQKIVAARTQRPFASLDETVERGVLNKGQLDKIRSLATVG